MLFPAPIVIDETPEPEKRIAKYAQTMSAYAYLMKMGPALSSKAASEKAVLLYKAIVQQLPKIISTYQMNMTMDEAKKIVKNKFYANADVKDPRVAEILVYRGAMELDELVNQVPHEYQAAYYFESEPLRERDKFMAQKPDYLDQLLSDFEPNL